jgi:hypothetical protein
MGSLVDKSQQLTARSAAPPRFAKTLRHDDREPMTEEPTVIRHPHLCFVGMAQQPTTNYEEQSYVTELTAAGRQTQKRIGQNHEKNPKCFINELQKKYV